MNRLAYLFLLVLSIACESENEETPRTYHFHSFETGAVRIFTNDGEISDAKLSSRFVDQWGDYFYRFGAFEYDDFDFSGRISLGTNNQSIIHTPDTTMTVKYQLKGGVIYFELPDTAYSTHNLANMRDRRFLYTPLTQTGIEEGIGFGFPPLPTYNYGYLPCLYAVEDGDVIKFPFVSLLEKNCSANDQGGILGNCTSITALSNVNNNFDASYINYIVNRTKLNPEYEYRDTVVVQENYIVFRKQ